MRRPSGKLHLLAALLFLTACKKTNVSSNKAESAGITGQWNLVSDSTFEGMGPTNQPVDYAGEAGDYFSFSTNGNVYTKEGNSLDTLAYRTVSNSSIIISDFGMGADTSTITGLTRNFTSGPATQTIIIESPFFATYDGMFWRKVTLTR
jgi:hypothetical protein